MTNNKQYTTAQHAESIREELKKQIPGCEFKVEYKHRFCTAYINVSLMAGPFSAILDSKKSYVQVNKDDMERKITKEAIVVIKKANAIAKAQSEIGITDKWPFSGFYVIMEVGGVETPFTKKEVKAVPIDDLGKIKDAVEYYASKYMDDSDCPTIDIIKTMYLDSDRKLASIKGWVSDELGITSMNREKHEHTALCVLDEIDEIGYNMLFGGSRV